MGQLSIGALVNLGLLHSGATASLPSDRCYNVISLSIQTDLMVFFDSVWISSGNGWLSSLRTGLLQASSVLGSSLSVDMLLGRLHAVSCGVGIGLL